MRLHQSRTTGHRRGKTTLYQADRVLFCPGGGCLMENAMGEEDMETGSKAGLVRKQLGDWSSRSGGELCWE